MTFEEFKKKIDEDPDWAPGWDAIDGALEILYPLQNPGHYSTPVERRVNLGGDLYLDGVAVYDSKKGYKHLVSYGMTELYANEELFGQEKNMTGYEMTMKIKEDSGEKCDWAVNILNVLAKFTFTQKQYFVPMQFINLSGPVAFDRETQISGFLAIEDTELDPVYSIYGETAFLQLVGITADDLKALQEDPQRTEELYNSIKSDNPDFVTDLENAKSYLK